METLKPPEVWECFENRSDRRFFPIRWRVTSIHPLTGEIVLERVDDEDALTKQTTTETLRQRFKPATWRSSPWTKLGVALMIIAVTIIGTLLIVAADGGS